MQGGFKQYERKIMVLSFPSLFGAKIRHRYSLPSHYFPLTSWKQITELFDIEVAILHLFVCVCVCVFIWYTVVFSH